MKVYIYSEAMDKIGKSGVGRAIFHQMTAAALNGIEVVDCMEKADVVHINTVLPRSFGLARECKKKDVPLVYHAHSTREDFRNSYIGANAVAGLFKQWLIKCYSMGDVIVTPSEYSKRLLQGYGIKNEILAISNGIDIGEYRRDEQAGREFRGKFGFAEDDKIVMSAGLLIKRKGVHDFAEIARRLPQYKFIWFGTADLRFVGKEVRSAVKNAPENLTFAGYVEKPVLQTALSGSDLFLFPSYEETEGIVVLEALAMRIPVLLRNIPVYDSWICSRGGGIGTIPTSRTASTISCGSRRTFSKTACRHWSETVTRSRARAASNEREHSLPKHTDARSSFAVKDGVNASVKYTSSYKSDVSKKLII